MALSKIRIELELDDKNFTLRAVNAGKVVQNLQKSFETTSQSVQRMEHHMSGMMPRLRDFTVTMSMMRGALLNIKAATFGWQSSIIKANADIERMTMLMRGMSAASTELGRNTEAADNVARLIGLAKTAPFSINEMSNSIVKFKSVGIDPLNGSFKALADSVAAFGGSDDILHRASVAIQQMAGKGVISMEELRQQLGEAVPTAIRLMARSMGMTFKDLVNQISKGTVESKSALDRMFMEFDRSMGGASERMMKTWIGMTQRMKTEWTLFLVEIGKTGYFEKVKSEFAKLIDYMASGGLDNVARGIGEALVSIIEGLKGFFAFAQEHWGAISASLKAFSAIFVSHFILKVLGGIVHWVFPAVGALGKFLVAFQEIGLWLGMSGVPLFSRIIQAIRTLGGALLAAMGPMGLLTAAVAAGIGIWAAWGDEAKKTYDKVRDSVVGITEEEARLVEEHAANLQKVVKGQGEIVADLSKKLQAMRADDSTPGWKLADMERQYKEAMDVLVATNNERNGAIETGQAAHAELMTRYVRKETYARTSLYNAQIAEQTQNERVHYNDELNKLDAQLRAKEITQKVYDERRLEQANILYAAQEKILIGFNDTIAAQMKSTVGKEQAVWANMLEWSRKQLAELTEKRKKADALLTTKPTLLADETGKLSKLGRYLERFASKTAEFKGEVAGLDGEVEKFKHLLTSGALGAEGLALVKPENVATLQEYIAQIKEGKASIEGLQNLNRAKTMMRNTNEELLRSEARLSHETSILNEQLLTGVLAEPSSGMTRLESLKIQFDEMYKTALPKVRAELDKTIAKLKDAMTLQGNVDTKAFAVQLKTKTKEITSSLKTQKQQIVDTYQTESALMEASYKKALEHATDRTAVTEEFNAYQIAMAEKLARDLETPMQKINRDWQNITERMQDAITKWADKATDVFVEFAKTGKWTFKDLISSILEDLLRLQVQKSITGPIFSAISGGLDASGGGGSFLSSIGSFISNLFASGGVMSSSGKVPLKAYSTGGVATSPQVAIFGEGRKNEAYVPLPDGKRIPVDMQGGGTPNVQVNVINQSGQKMDAQQGNMKFDGKQFVLDVVLTAASTPGKFRDNIKGALK